MIGLNFLGRLQPLGLIFAAIFLGSVVAGCDPPLTAKTTLARVAEVEIANDANFQLLPLSDSEMDGSFNQTVTMVFGGERQTFLSQVEIDSQHMTMVGLATFGARIFTLDYQGETLKFATIPQLSSTLRPENLLADFQLVNWPVEPIRAQFEASQPRTYWLSPPRKLEIEEVPGHRSIFFGGLKVVDITYEDGEDGSKEVVMQNLDRGYTLYITEHPEIEF